MTENQHAHFSCVQDPAKFADSTRLLSSSTGDVVLPFSVTTIKRMKRLSKWREVQHVCTSVAVWHLASLAHLFWAFSDKISVIRLVDTFFLDQFNWLIVFWRNRRGSFTWFSRQPKSDKNHFWVSCIGRPKSWPIFLRLQSGNFWPNYPFILTKEKRVFSRLIYGNVMTSWRYFCIYVGNSVISLLH